MTCSLVPGLHFLKLHVFTHVELNVLPGSMSLLRSLRRGLMSIIRTRFHESCRFPMQSFLSNHLAVSDSRGVHNRGRSNTPGPRDGITDCSVPVRKNSTTAALLHLCCRAARRRFRWFSCPVAGSRDSLAVGASRGRLGAVSRHLEMVRDRRLRASRGLPWRPETFRR